MHISNSFKQLYSSGVYQKREGVEQIRSLSYWEKQKPDVLDSMTAKQESNSISLINSIKSLPRNIRK